MNQPQPRPRRIRTVVPVLLAAAVLGAVGWFLHAGRASRPQPPRVVPSDDETAGARADRTIALAPDDPRATDAADGAGAATISRALAAEQGPVWRRVSGLTRRAETLRPVRCMVAAFDENGAPLEVRGRDASALFVLEVPEGAVRLVASAVQHRDLDDAQIAIPPRGDVDQLDIPLQQARGSLRGRIIDASGMGVAGVTVILDYGYARRTSDGGGHFTFRPLRDGNYTLRVEDVAYAAGAAGGGAPLRVRIDQRQQVEPALFIIERGSTIRGIVRAGAEKAPLAGVQLVLTRPGSVEQHRAVTSDGDGEFELARLTGGDFVLTAHVPDGGFARASASVDDLGTDEVRVVELHLADGSASVSGTLRDSGGDALPFGALVAERLGDDGAVLGRSTTRADSGGRFTFAALPIGRWRIGADATYCRQHNWTCSAPVTIDLTHGEPPPIDVRLARGAAIDGRVESASRRGAVLLRLHFPDGTQREQQSLGDGAFAFGGLAAGAYELEALDPEFEHGAALARMIVQLSTGEMESVNLKVP